MATLSAGFDPQEVVESIEADRTYPKVAVVSYLLRLPISNCFRRNETTTTSKAIIDCEELLILVDFYGLLPLGTDHAQRFHGQNIIESEIRRSTDTRVEPKRQRLNREQIRALRKQQNESVGPTKSRRRQKAGEE